MVLLLWLSPGVTAVLSNISLRNYSDNALVHVSFTKPLTSDDYTCSKTKRCKTGCCGPIDSTTGIGNCGYGPEFCGKGCSSDCGRKSECDAGWGREWSTASTCPLNVCCSKFGFCGTTPSFCGTATVPSPECNGKSAHKRTVGYYEGWNLEHACGKMAPDQIPLGYYTHLNFAFAYIDPQTFRIAPMNNHTASLYKAVTGLKRKQSKLEVWIAIGGWDMNDPGHTQYTFSDLAASGTAQDAFFNSLLSFMQSNDFDGVDLDWEYPVSEDHGGRAGDFVNFVTLLQRLRKRLNQSGRSYGVSITLPASYWYLRGFDIANLERYVDFFNVMTYDIHGTWDTMNRDSPYAAYAHTNLTEINQTLTLLWRNNINPARINLGLGFYGRSFTMKDPRCMAPGCLFTAGGRCGECTATSGVLSNTEIQKIVKENITGANVSFYKEDAVKVLTWDRDQWVSFDDVETLKLKLEFANRRCLGGTMAWAVDLDRDGMLIEALGTAMVAKKKAVWNEAMHHWLIPEGGSVDVDDVLGWKRKQNNVQQDTGSKHKDLL
ncbi:chitinase [Aspergillus homomorphus CBS 101889]|uniref:chitinase n=1 Tax=Aspergillus homomorphus (strain CBS 101889) TaxID=1450537 RepID=A0A395I4U5_ASPHC|nr:chitinase [Aspergillus homomorphus CBS 101889]RAL14759.1 chitinase [Aspergillus homomorphus CBS 101889]